MCPPSLLSTFGSTPSSGLSHGSKPAANELPDFVPRDEMCISAYNLAATNLPIAILNHSLRVYLYATKLAKSLAPIYGQDDKAASSKHSLLFVACILHDIGCAPRFDGPQRFEVEGADAAKGHLLSFSRAEQDAHDVWVAIACHTSAHIAEKISPLAYLIRISVLFDFTETGKLSGHGGDGVQVLGEELRSEVERSFPRLEPEKVLGDAVVEQARRQKGKAPAASWPGILLRAAEENPGWEGVNKAF